MNRAIDMSVIMKNIDEVSRIMKNKEMSLSLQQLEANNSLMQESKMNSEKVVPTQGSLMQGIDSNKKNEIHNKTNKKENKKENKNIKKKHNGKDLNKGRWLDING